MNDLLDDIIYFFRRVVRGVSRGWRSGGYLHPIKNWLIRLRTGSGCCDLYSLYYYLAPQLATHLKNFKAKKVGHPYCFIDDEGKEMMTAEKWDAMLDEMIWAFEYYADEWREGTEEEWKRAQRGTELFGKWFASLWI